MFWGRKATRWPVEFRANGRMQDLHDLRQSEARGSKESTRADDTRADTY